MLKAGLIGNLGHDPVMRFTPDGQGITSRRKGSVNA